MHTLLLRLCGPMQAWGTQSRHTDRDTGLEPSKSGVLGLCCAALGIGRAEPIDHLARLAMAVRIDREGVVQRDFQTALDVVKSDGKSTGTVVSNRHFLADGDFLVGLESNDLKLLQQLDGALRNPIWPLFLGRKAFVASVPIALPGQADSQGGVREQTPLLGALRAEKWWRRPATPPWQANPTHLRVVVEAAAVLGAERRMDQPGPGAAFDHRRFLPRYVLTDFWELGADVQIGGSNDA